MTAVSPVSGPTGASGFPLAIWAEVAAERDRARTKHGDTSMESQPVNALDRLFILIEECGEVAELFLKAGINDDALRRRDYVHSALTEAVKAGDRARRINDARHSGAGPQPCLPNLDAPSLRSELIQVAAMAGGWADAIGGSDV